MKYRAIGEELIETEIDRVSVFIGGEHIISVIPQGSLRKTMNCINMAIEAYYYAYSEVTGKLPKDGIAGKGGVRYSLLQLLKLIAGK